MLIAAELRLPTKFSKTQKQEIAERVIFELGLAKVKRMLGVFDLHQYSNLVLCYTLGGGHIHWK